MCILYVTVHAKRGIFAYATEIAFLVSFERVSVVIATGAIGSVIAVTDPERSTYFFRAFWFFSICCS